MFGKRKKTASKIASLILSAALFIPTMYGMTVNDFVRADDDVVKTTENTRLGVDDISDPRTPTSPDDAWNGSYVYFGKYSDTPVKYRVLDRKTSEFSESGKYTMFLDSEYTITSSPFSLANPPTNVWADSQVRTWMNNEFLQSSFSSIERDAIAQSKKNGGENYANGSFAANFFGQTVGLNDYIFALDVGDVLNPEYGYSSDPGWAIDASTSVWTRSYVANRNKCKLDSGNIGGWWLRSGPADDVGAGYVSTRGDIGNLGTAYTDGGAGMAPALNVDHDSILFSTAIKGTYGELGTEYKLTLLDPEMIVSVPEDSVSIEGNKVNFGYGLSGQNFALRSQISYIVTSKPFGSDDNSILDYGATAGGNYQGYLTLSDSVSGTWGEDYYIYIFAEKFNGTYESDYAGPLVELVKPESSVPVVFEGKTVSNTKLGVDQISNPAILLTGENPWLGSFVYFGKYNGQPIRFRVLDKASTKYTTDGSKTLFLDSDKVLYEEYFNNTISPTDPNANKWSESDLKASLNGSGFLDKDGVFTQAEKDAIAESYVDGYSLSGINQEAFETFGSSVGLTGEKVFALDVTDILNRNYGYYDYRGLTSVDHSNYSKEAAEGSGIEHTAWWLRNAGAQPSDSGMMYAGEAMYYSYSTWQVNDTKAVAPALNIDHDSILFSTAIKGTYGELGTAYKLTLLDPEMIVSVTEGSVSIEGNKVNFGYGLSGQNFALRSQISYIVTSKPFGSDDNSILDYGATAGGNYKGYLTLSDSVSGTWGEDYHIYIFAEKFNGTYESDYAGPLVELVKPESSVPVVFEGKTASNTKLGVDDISDPRTPTSPDDAWNGSYVYFGKYSDTPVKYRVLDKDSTLFSDKTTVFLDCDSTLFDADFDSFVNANDPGSNVWINSDIRTALNGDAFLEKSGTFTAMEKSAIVASTVAGHPLTSVNADAVSEFVNYIGLENDKIFLLDAEDVLNPEYGYYDALANGPFGSSAPYHPAYNWYKCELQSPSDFHLWWLRSQDHELDSQHADYFAGVIFYGVGGTQVNEAQGVAPAMNIDSESILFSTAIKGTYGELGTEYKLTLLDPEMVVSVTEGSVRKDWNRISFETTHSGKNITNMSRSSYLITSGTIGSANNSILDYGEVHGGNGSAYFVLPSSLSGTWGQDYHVYVFAEDLNGKYESDYASAPVELANPETSGSFSGKTLNNTKLGVDGIHDPAIPSSPSEPWNGSIVYFGQYEGNPIRFRVLDKDSTAFGDDTTLFLDSEGALFSHQFSDNGSNQWVGSDIRAALNGNAFLDKSGVFTNQEKDAIYYSNTQSHVLTGLGQDIAELIGNAVGLEDDQVFLLDVEDLFNESYGYKFDIADFDNVHSNAGKWAYFKDQMAVWALRNAEAGTNTTSAFVTRTGDLGTIGISYMSPRDIAPALNVDHDSILFSTAIKGTYGELGTAYKLTLLDPEMIVSVTEGSVSIEGNKVNFGYGLSGQNFALRSQISYIVTSKPFGSDDNSILDYGATAGGNYQGYLTLSDSVSGTWGEDYHIYIFAEKFNGTYESDYAGPLVELVKPESSVPVVFEGKTVSNTKLGVDEIHDPATHNGEVEGWQGSIVYFGQYDGRPNRFRVLDKDSTAFGDDTTLFLDSELVLFRRSFSSNGSNAWVGSDIRDALNGDEFLDKDGVFTRQEKKAIYYSNTQTHSLTGVDQRVSDWFGNTVGLQNDQIFLLDIEDLLNEQYGYVSDNSFMYECRSNAAKWAAYDDGWTSWWLRNAEKDSNTLAAYVADNYVSTIGISNMYQEGVAPALNVDHDSILFSSAVKGTYGELDTEYKLTLIDPELQVSLTGDFTKTGLKITVPYSLAGDSVNANTKMSYMFTSKALGEAGNTILAYGTMNQENSQSGSFYLFKGLTGTWGQDYHVYVFAENVNGTYESDYASAPVELAVSNPGPVFSGKTTQNTKLGTKQMKTPAVPQSANDAWNGSFVYFGKYEGQPVLYRVLDPNSSIFGSNTLFLDCDEGLYLDYFDEENQTNNWNDSDIRANLNGDSFLNKDGVFTSAEKASIAESEISGHPLTGILQSAIDTYGNYVGLDGDKVFVLDAEDTFNASYGYCNGCSDILGYTNYSKFYDGQLYACWLRNAAGSWQGTSNLCAGTIPQNSRMEVYADYAVAPALNVSQDSIIFSTAVEGDYGALGSQYKLTLKDPDIGLTVGDLEVNGRSVSFTYTVSGAHKNDVTQISYLVVQKGTGYPKIDTIAAYGAVTLSGNHGGDFELPANLTGDFGTDYKVYILAEDINGTFETDYADMAELTLPKIVFDLTNGPITCDQEQLDALAELYWNGDIDADEPIEDSVDLNRIDVDMDGTWDFELENNVLTETSTCSIKAKKEFTNIAQYASVTFIVGASPKIARHAIRLTGSIGVKFGVDFPDGTDVSKCYVEFVTSTGRKTTVRTSSAGETDSSRYYIFSINCLEMADEITATLYYDGEAIQTDTYSAMAYILHVKNNAGRYDERVVDLVDALQTYGYYMQKSDWSDNVSHYAIPKPSRTLSSADVDRATTELNLDALCGIQKNLGTSGISSSMKISLSLTSATELKLYVKPENSSVVMPSNAKAVDFNGVTYYEFSISNIGPHLLDTMRTFTITTNQGTATVSLPALFYVKNMLNKSTTTNDQKLALTAYYRYYEAAKAITG